MDSMAKQFSDIIEPRMKTLNRTAGELVAIEIATQMLENTEAGRGFGNDPYQKEYSQRSKRERRKLNLQTSHADLRRKNKRIETVNTSSNDKETNIKFSSGGRIFKLHHEGLYDGRVKMPERSIFPKSPESVPESIFKKAAVYIAEALRGK